MKDTTCIDDVVTAISNPLEEASNSNSKCETNTGTKSHIVRRTSSLYSVVKRIKSGKRSARQLPTNRKSLKNQRRLNNAENGPMISKIRSSRLGVKTTIHKPDHRLTVDKNLQKIVGKRTGNKTTVKIINEQTSGVINNNNKKDTKRLKLVQHILKTKPEIGESSTATTTSRKLTAKKKVKIVFTRDKRSKSIINRLREPEQNKSRNKTFSKANNKI